MLKMFKQAALKSLKTVGVSTMVHNSRWRRQRLLILAYHGISLSDEHLWNGSLFTSADILRARLELLRRSRCAVLPLGEAVERLYANDLPDRAVALTFDDGTSDFYRKAFPLIQEFGFPVTLYLTTFYSHYQRPVFDLMCSYLLWKGRSKTLDLKSLTGEDLKTDLRTNDSQEHVLGEIHAFARRQKLSADEKDAFAASLAARLDVDYEALLEQRVMHNLTADEVGRLAAGGIDIQLHTHRHRTPTDRQPFLREIEDNRKSIQQMTGKNPTHFCYPSGVYDLRFLPWLKEAGVVSGTTCEFGFASRSSNPLLLPRFLDNATLSSIEFESWLTGVSAALPRRNLTEREFAGGTS
ncbi:MAG: polysaccharide deacetylase family protein [Acidobacteriota bacterium]|nr:polysaccharide deacetylase family protein [Acidobacteriota bacterium]